MVAYNFMAQFAEPVSDGRKPHTVRANGKRRHAIRGDRLQLYTGMRSPKCRLLREVLCIGSWPVHLPACSEFGPGVWSINHRVLSQLQMRALAQADGFKDEFYMGEWIVATHGEDFSGTLIAWEWRPYLPA